MKKIKNIKTEKRLRIKRKIRARVSGTIERPRLSVYKSNRGIYVQIIDDAKGSTLVSASDLKVKGAKMKRAQMVGKSIAEHAKAKGITQVVFDRNGFKYTGRLKTLADEARSNGLIF